jgi:hypothetical protein
MNRSQTPVRRAWALLIGAPLLFLAAIIVVSIYYGVVTRGDAQVIAEQTPRAVPVMLAAVQLLLLVFLVRTLRSERLAWSDIGWRLGHGQVLWREALIGVVPGAVLAVLYFTVLSPSMTWLQSHVGDYVPAGELTGALGSAPGAFLPGQRGARAVRRGEPVPRIRVAAPAGAVWPGPGCLHLVRVLRAAALGRWDLVHPADGLRGGRTVRRSACLAAHPHRAVCRASRTQRA